MPLANNAIVHCLFYSLTGDVVFTATCFVLAFLGLLVGSSYQVQNDDNLIVLRKPWPILLWVNVTALYAVWLCLEMFVCSFPLAVSLPIAAFFFCPLVLMIYYYGMPETMQFDLQERICTHTRGWLGATRTVKIGGILGLELRTLYFEEGGISYLCRL